MTCLLGSFVLGDASWLMVRSLVDLMSADYISIKVFSSKVEQP